MKKYIIQLHLIILKILINDYGIMKTMKPNIFSEVQNVKENQYRIVPIMWLE